MVGKTAPTLEQIRDELSGFPDPVSEEFSRVLEAMSQSLTDDQKVAWAQAGVDIAKQTVRSWEAASQYYSVSTTVLASMPFSYFTRWAACGSSLTDTMHVST